MHLFRRFARRRRIYLRASALVFTVALGLLVSQLPVKAQAPDTRPNIVLLVADDLGYGDLSRYGGEASTPNLDSLMDAGIQFTNFRVLPTCSPTRSLLMTGVDNHLNGFGTMAGHLKDPTNPQIGQPGYEGYLNDRVVTVATLLKEAGYHTYMSGKWHLGKEVAQGRGQPIFSEGYWPIDRGFERSFGVLEGGSEQYGRLEDAGPTILHFFEDDQMLNAPLASDFYTTKNYMDKIIEYIDAGKAADGATRKPFFAYFAPTSPHWPFQAPQEYIDRYVNAGTYDVGWDALRAQRFDRLKQLDLISDTATLPPRWPGVPEWDNDADPVWSFLLSRVTPYPQVWGITDVDDLRRTMAKQMAVSMAMIDYMDLEIGRLIQHLKDIGEYDNTVFIFLSDNGADGGQQDFSPVYANWFAQLGIDNSYENLGQRNSYLAMSLGFSQVQNTPFYGAKSTIAGAGIHTPMAVAYPAGDVLSGEKNDAFITALDIVPTILDYAGVTHPAGSVDTPNVSHCTVSYKDKTICPMNGRSLRGLWEGNATAVYGEDDPVAFELFGTVNKALFMGDWKIVKLNFLGLFGSGEWQLFNIREDPFEQNDLATLEPERLQTMVDIYDQYEQDVGFVPRFLANKYYLPIIQKQEEILLLTH